MYSQRQEDLALFSSHLEAKKAGPLVCPSAAKPIRSCRKAPQSESPQASPSLRANLNTPTLHAQIADTQFSSTLITYQKGEVRRALATRSSQNSPSPTLGESKGIEGGRVFAIPYVSRDFVCYERAASG
jgi:hypothetical protein